MEREYPTEEMESTEVRTIAPVYSKGENRLGIRAIGRLSKQLLSR